MAFVKTLVLELTRQISPVTKDGTKIDATNLGTVEPAKFTKEQVLTYFNDARIVLFNALAQIYGSEDLSVLISGTVINTSVTFATDGSAVSVARPVGYMRFISMADASNVPVYRLPETLVQAVRGGTDQHLIQSATNIFIFEEGSKFYHYGAFITNGEAIKLSYFGLPLYTISDVLTAATTVEAINDTEHPKLIELAVARSQGQGSAGLNAMAQKLIGAK